MRCWYTEKFDINSKKAVIAELLNLSLSPLHITRIKDNDFVLSTEDTRKLTNDVSSYRPRKTMTIILSKKSIQFSLQRTTSLPPTFPFIIPIFPVSSFCKIQMIVPQMKKWRLHSLGSNALACLPFATVRAPHGSCSKTTSSRIPRCLAMSHAGCCEISKRWLWLCVFTAQPLCVNMSFDISRFDCFWPSIYFQTVRR